MANTDGIFIHQNALKNVIGGVAPGGANLIAFNAGVGVRVDGVSAISNTIRANSIHSNGLKGIDNTNGGNGELSPPVITAAGSASGTACADCIVDVYSDDEDEGRDYHGSTVADSNGDWSFSDAVLGPNVTATATDANGSTSEFSAPFNCAANGADIDGDGVCDSGDPTPLGECAGLPVTIRGSAGPDSLTGAAGTDVIHGADGDDFIQGRGGDDTICGGNGDDLILGQHGNDSLYGEAGDDDLNGGKGGDFLDGGPDADRCNGSEGLDSGAFCEVVAAIP